MKRLTWLSRTLAISVIAISLTTIGLVGPAKPADAGNGDWYRLVNDNWGLSLGCLTTNWAHEVYVGQCTAGNNFQRWRLWFGGFTQNLETGDCLTLLPGWQLATRDCSHPLQPDRYQTWHQWNGGWIRSAAGPADPVCVIEYHSTSEVWVEANYCSQTILDHRWHQIQF